MIVSKKERIFNKAEMAIARPALLFDFFNDWDILPSEEHDRAMEAAKSFVDEGWLVPCGNGWHATKEGRAVFMWQRYKWDDYLPTGEGVAIIYED